MAIPLEKQIWIATGNAGKLAEFKSLFAPLGFDVHSQSELSSYFQPPETGQTFTENARIKARSLKAVRSGTWVIADDSGIEVEALKGLPGIHSARYAGPKASDEENYLKLLKMMNIRAVPNRNARFVCTIVAFNPAGQEFVFDGILDGTVATAPKGKDGFGYDAIFIPNGETQTLAELGLIFKNKISHRAQAIKKLAEILR